MSLRTGFSVALLGIALLAASCGESGETSAVGASPAPDPSGADASSRDRPQVFARDAQLEAGSTAILLRIPKIGRLRASCRQAYVDTSFEASPSLPGGDIVVRSGVTSRSGTVNQYRGNKFLGKKFAAPPMAKPDIQTWSVAGFAPAGVRPTMITVAAKGGAYRPFRCAVSALANVGGPISTITK
ncbi:MAG: hypothetical protein J0H66_10635 [Solirubrobacterales bacterium]|nr:hypothetical protein [Solirubrobacterales bacterium]